MTEPKCPQAQSARIVQRVADSDIDKPHPLVGAGVHFRDQYGRVQDRAVIVAVIPSNNASVGDLVLMQYFMLRKGEPPTQRLISLSELSSSDRWVFYNSLAEMIWAEAEKKSRESEIFRRGSAILACETSAKQLTSGERHVLRAQK
jgi:hypothetical protein